MTGHEDCEGFSWLFEEREEMDFVKTGDWYCPMHDVSGRVLEALK